jgi:hypothetical protein
MINPWTSLLTPDLAEVLPAKPDSANPADTGAATVLIPLPALAVIGLTGPESIKFLQGQTTTDFREVEKGRVLPGAVCSLKGRVLFSFIAIPDGENILLVLPENQIEDALAHLKKYAVFSRTRLDHAGMALAGISGAGAEERVKSLVGDVPAQGRVIKAADGKWVARTGAEPRYLLGLPAETLAAEWPALQQNTTLASENLWWAADIRDGLATVFAGSRDLFQPQELNYPALEGVSYNKGCYTGQEVVARLYFRGKLKQRLYRLEASDTALPAIGSKIVAEGKSVGEVVIAARGSAGKTELLAVVKNQAVHAGTLSLEASGSRLSVLALPYELAADKEE